MKHKIIDSLMQKVRNLNYIDNKDYKNELSYDYNRDLYKNYIFPQTPPRINPIDDLRNWQRDIEALRQLHSQSLIQKMKGDLLGREAFEILLKKIEKNLAEAIEEDIQIYHRYSSDHLSVQILICLGENILDISEHLIEGFTEDSFMTNYLHRKSNEDVEIVL